MSDHSEHENDESDDPEMSDAFRVGMRQAGYHVLRAGYELLAGVSAFLDAVGGAGEEEPPDEPGPQWIEVE